MILKIGITLVATSLFVDIFTGIMDARDKDPRGVESRKLLRGMMTLSCFLPGVAILLWSLVDWAVG